MIICKNCGKDNASGKFCTACGTGLVTEQKLICSACKREYSGGNFCVACGGQLISTQQSEQPEQNLVCVQCSRTFASGTFCTFCGGTLKRAESLNNGNGVLLKQNFIAVEEPQQSYEQQSIFSEEYGDSFGMKNNNQSNEVFSSANSMVQDAYVDMGYETDNDPEKTISPEGTHNVQPEPAAIEKDRVDSILEDFLRGYRAEKYNIKPAVLDAEENTSQPEDIYSGEKAEVDAAQEVTAYEDIYTDSSAAEEKNEQIPVTDMVFEDINSNLPEQEVPVDYADEEPLPQTFEDVMSFPNVTEDEAEADRNIAHYIENAVAASTENAVQYTQIQQEETVKVYKDETEPVYNTDTVPFSERETEAMYNNTKALYAQETETEESVDIVPETQPIHEEAEQIAEPVMNPDFVPFSERETEAMYNNTKALYAQEAETEESVDIVPETQPIHEEAEQITEPVMNPDFAEVPQPVYEQPQPMAQQVTEPVMNPDFAEVPQPVYEQPQPAAQSPQQYNQPVVPAAPSGFSQPVQPQYTAPAGAKTEIDPMFGPAPNMVFTMYSQNGAVQQNYAQPMGQMTKQELKAQRKAEKLRLKEEKRRMKQQMKNSK